MAVELALIIILIFCCRQCQIDNRSLKQQLAYKTDSLSLYISKTGDAYAANKLYILAYDQIKDENNKLYDEIKQLQKKSKPIYISKTEIKTVIDTVYTNTADIIHNNDTIQWHWYYNSKYFNINGLSSYSNDSVKTIVNNISIPVELTLDIIEENKQLKTIAKTDNPYVHITRMDNVMLDPSNSRVIRSYNQKRFGIGPMIGYGINPIDFKPAPYIGIGISWSLI